MRVRSTEQSVGIKVGGFDPDIIYIRVHTEAVGIQKKVPGGDMSIN